MFRNICIIDNFLFENNFIFEGFYNTLCSLFKVKDYLLYGDKYEYGASWIGAYNIINKFNNTAYKILEFEILKMFI